MREIVDKGIDERGFSNSGLAQDENVDIVRLVQLMQHVLQFLLSVGQRVWSVLFVVASKLIDREWNTATVTVNVVV
jgi:hypothetical protein